MQAASEGEWLRPIPIVRAIIWRMSGRFSRGCAPELPSVFGLAIGRFAIAMRQLTALSGHAVRTAGLSVWMGAASIVAGVLLVVAGLARYRKTRAQLEAGTFEPAGFVLDLVTILTVLLGLALDGYLIYTEKSLG
jgi:uncharacterized membrane protein YidH (DUF202 family)